MKAACILVLAVALAAGGATAFLIGSDEEKKPEAPPVAQMETTEPGTTDFVIGPVQESQLRWTLPSADAPPAASNSVSTRSRRAVIAGTAP